MSGLVAIPIAASSLLGADGGEMAQLLRTKDRAATPLGRPERRPTNIRTAVAICLKSRFPILLWTGPDSRIVLNDAYIPFLGPIKHPAMRAAIDLVRPSLHTWDPLTYELEWDDRIRAMSNLPPGAPVNGQIWLSAIHHDDRPKVEAAVAQCTDPQRDGIYALEYRVIGINRGVQRLVQTARDARHAVCSPCDG